MNERFDNPPLVELVAELRWKDLSLPAGLPPGFPPGFPFPGSQVAFDQQLPEMNSAMTSIGYGQSERLMPAGFPAPAEAPIVRYRYSGVTEKNREHLPSTLFQIGSGIFTANAVKPYKSWDDFRPVVEHGVRILLETQKAKVGGYSLTLRYIDAFREDLTDDMTHMQFLKNVLGFGIDLPPVLLTHAEDRLIDIPMSQIIVPLKFGSLQLQMTQGEIDGGRAFILENVVIIDGLIEPRVEPIMESFSKARDVIHDVFVNLSAPLRDKMVPVEVQG
ncbi:TIGR04255 family protein [Pseudomonas fluorescens]|uniref:TIGR04255 family protein n=1 Tax=Pseudomonas fluorescens TaxID=294 RepID=UPI00155D9E22|nr:TIGR04255 family protein [Pseudomonas fluorescens]